MSKIKRHFKMMIGGFLFFAVFPADYVPNKQKRRQTEQSGPGRRAGKETYRIIKQERKEIARGGFGKATRERRGYKPTNRAANGAKSQRAAKATDQKANGPKSQRAERPTDRETNGPRD